MEGMTGGLLIVRGNAGSARATACAAAPL